MTKLFVSDLHLDASRPEATSAFLKFLKTDAREASALYILGDLFEYWIDDSDPNPHYRQVIEGLADFTAQGHKCYVMHGNRDFLLGPLFASETGTVILYDPTLIFVENNSVLISHGDAFCTDDIAYQRYKRIVRDPRVQRFYNRLPLWLKRRIAKAIRGKSQETFELKPAAILDVNQQSVETTLREYQVNTVLHGHTHRPAVHQFQLDDKDAMRIVLGDWYEQGSILRWDSNGPELLTIKF